MIRKKIVYGIATRSGNGFKKGQIYLFKHRVNSNYETTIGNLLRIVSYPFSNKSAHLFDGTHRDDAGKFIEVKNNFKI